MSPRPARIVAIAVLLGALLATAACNGPSQRGIEARKNANDRFDRVTAQVAYDQARQALATGQFEVALTNIDRAIERFPKDIQYLVLRGRVLIEQSRMHQAKETLDYALEVDPKCAEAHYFLGVLAQRCGDEAGALEHYDAARALDPKNLQFLAACAEMMLALGRMKEARTLIEEGSPSFEYSPVLQQLRARSFAMEGNARGAAAVMELAQSQDPDDAGLTEDLAAARFDAGEWADCLATLERPAMASVRTRPDLVRMRARCLIMLNRSTEARDLLLATTPGGEPPVEHLMTLGFAAWACQDWGRLDTCGRELVNSHPRLGEGYLFLGAVERQRGNLQESDRWLEQACQRPGGRDMAESLRKRVQASLAARRDTAEGG